MVFCYSASIGSVMIVPAARKISCRRKTRRWSQLVTTPFLISLVLLIGGANAEPSAPSLTIDYDKLPTIVINAKDVPLVEILHQLVDRLHFQVDNPPPAEKSARISGSFVGEIAEILQRVLLREMSYVILYRGSAIERIIIVPSGGGASIAAAPSSPGEEKDTSVAAAEPTTQVAAPPSTSGRAAGASQMHSPVAKLLQAQASMLQRAVTDAGSVGNSDGTAAANTASRAFSQPGSASTGAPFSLAGMTRAAQTNVQMLVKALNSACIGESCAH
jgi:hypothetical protein